MAIERKNYITPHGLKRLQDEHDFLKMTERPKVTKLVAWAASLGDRSENADYQYGKKRLREIDRRLRFLIRRINEALVVDPLKQIDGKIMFGATVTLEDGDGEEKVVQIVGVDEVNTDKGRISWKSPIGKGLLGKEEGDDVTIKVPSGLKEFTITEVEYREVHIEEYVYDGPDQSQLG